jgi:hypothetical protein
MAHLEDGMNAINLITPYRYAGMWVFDDADVGLLREPFVAGADTMIDVLTAGDENAANGFTMLFSGDAFPQYDVVLEWRGHQYGGNVYYCQSLAMQCWLCPALLKYFAAAPRKIYVRVILNK